MTAHVTDFLSKKKEKEKKKKKKQKKKKTLNGGGVGLPGGPRKVGAQTWKRCAPEGWCPEGWCPEGWGTQGRGTQGRCTQGRGTGGAPKWEAQKFALFFPSPPQFSFFFPLLGVFSFWLGLKRRALKMCTFGVLGLSCETPAAPRRGWLVAPDGWVQIIRGVLQSDGRSANKGSTQPRPQQHSSPPL